MSSDKLNPLVVPTNVIGQVGHKKFDSFSLNVCSHCISCERLDHDHFPINENFRILSRRTYQQSRHLPILSESLETLAVVTIVSTLFMYLQPLLTQVISYKMLHFIQVVSTGYWSKISTFLLHLLIPQLLSFNKLWSDVQQDWKYFSVLTASIST